MILITLGSQKFQFNRVLQAVDELIENGLEDEVFAQIGYSDYHPGHYQYKDFLDRDEFSAKVNAAQIVITHGGTGAIMSAVKRQKKVIAIPRRAQYGEHVDDHQLQIIEQFSELDLIEPCLNVEELGKALETVRNKTYKTYVSNTQTIIDSLCSIIDG